VALALAQATRPSACQLLHTMRAFEGAQAAADAASATLSEEPSAAIDDN